MKKSLRSIIATALLLTTLLLCACSTETLGTKTDAPTEKPSASPSEAPSASPAGSASASPSETKDPGIPGETVVMTIDGFEVKKSLFCYYYNTILSNYEYADKNFLTNTENAVEKVAEEALLECKKDAIFEKLFKESGAALPEKLEEDYAAYKQESSLYFTYYYGMSLEEFMKTTGMTEEIFKMFYIEDSIYFPAIKSYLTGGESPKGDISEEAFNEFAKDYATVRHILVGYTDGLSTEDALARANDLIQRYKDGEDFESLQKQFSNDYQTTGSNVYTFTYDEMVKEFEETSFKLQIGEISEPVKTQFGYHVILRLPYPEDFNDSYFYPYVADKYINNAAEQAVETKTEFFDVMMNELK